MGVKGLWQILEPSRRRVDLEYFRGKRMAIDMNIWLHQALKANVKGGRNSHLAILFRRICKLLFFGIRPIFVFDGAVPALKKATMAARRISRSTAKAKSCQARDRLLKRLFRRLAESAAKSQTPSEELIAEFVRRFNSTEEIRKAELDVEMFGSQSSSIEAAPPTAVLQLEEEQESASQLAWDFVDNSPSIDLQSDAFSALPIHAQLRVILILLNAQIQPSSQSARAGESFSQTQVNRLIARRDLALKKVEIESKMNEVLVASVTPRNLPSGLDMSVTAQRIASQDEGHAILMRKRSSKERADELKERLDRLLKGSVTEPVCDDEEDSKKALELENSPRDEYQIAEDHKVEMVEKIMKTLEEHSSSESEVCQAAHDNAQLEGGDESTDGPSDQSNESTVDIEADDVKNEGELKLKKESDSEVSSTDLAEFTEVLDDTTTSKASSDLKHLASQSEGNEDFDHKGRITSEQSNIEVETAVIEITSEAPSSDSGEFADVSEPPTPIQPVETLPKTQTFLEHEEEDDLAIDDDILRAEAEKLECQAQEATTSCVAEAQRLVQLFGFPLINSPEEAEAQCCYLQQLGLVDIVASDDSDVWVFGATLVCRHLFGRNKGKSGSGSSSLYCLKDIREQLGLDRRQFVRIALLCGSDYTDGLDNIGPIKALEILSTFATTSDPTFTSEEHEILLPLTEFRRRCQERGGGGRWTSTKFPADFPSEAVVKGYLSPRVENASEYAGFHWDTPNLLPLVKYAMEKFGWSRQKSEGTLAPVIGRFKATYEGAVASTIPLITDFFPRIETKKKASSRLTQATNRLKYATEFQDLPTLDTDWSTDADNDDEGAKPSTDTSRRRKSNEEPNKKTRKRKKRK